MGRFKIYDTNSLVSKLEDSKYVKCLVCEKVLKNIMGNIKRHYEQIHDTVLDATITPKKKSKRKTPTNGTSTESKPRKRNKNTKATASFPNGLNNIDYDWINEYQLDCESRPALTIISTPSGNKIYQQLETRKSSTSSQQDGADTSLQLSPSSSDQQFRANTVSASPQLNQIEIKSLDWHNNAAILHCLLTTRTPFDIPLQGFQASSTFEASLQSWCPNSNSAIDPKTISQLLDNRIQNVRRVIKDIAAKRFVYLKLDIASIKGNNLMLVNIQFIKDFQLKIFTLSVLELLDDLNAPVLKGQVLTALERYDIDINQVYSITKDYTYNVRQSAVYVKEEEQTADQNVMHDYCQQMSEQFAGHVLHFVACDVIKQLHENINQSRDTARKLQNCMHQNNLEPTPKLDNSNNWISIYDMVKSLLAVRKKIENNVKLVMEIDWVFISKFEASFKPVVDTAVQLQSNNFIMGDLYREWLACECELEDLSSTNEIALSLLQALRTRKAHLFENTSFLAALYLDPRFCYMGSMHFNDKQKKMAITQLLQIFDKLKSLDEIKNKFNATTNIKQVDNQRYLKLEKKMAANMGICNKMKIVLQSNLNNGTVSLEHVDRQSIEEALEQLQFDERLSFHANILDYWKTIKYKNPVLAKLAELALAVPATQATVNRAINVLPVMLMKHKSNISLNNLEYILLLQLNQDTVDKLA